MPPLRSPARQPKSFWPLISEACVATIAIHLAMLVLGQIAFHCARYTYIFVCYMYTHIYIPVHMCTYCNPATSKEAPSLWQSALASCWRGCCFVLFCFYLQTSDPEQKGTSVPQFKFLAFFRGSFARRRWCKVKKDSKRVMTR